MPTKAKRSKPQNGGFLQYAMLPTHFTALAFKDGRRMFGITEKPKPSKSAAQIYRNQQNKDLAREFALEVMLGKPGSRFRNQYMGSQSNPSPVHNFPPGYKFRKGPR